MNQKERICCCSINKSPPHIIEYISKIDSKIVLIDGNRLTELMIDNNVGVSILKNYEIKKIDSDYFTDEDVISH
ncbi:MAG: hypothetical protein M3227_00660 [Thermoproteota archaeon]|nr:hypothetical protein [Thermoproteota archaeon]